VLRCLLQFTYDRKNTPGKCKKITYGTCRYNAWADLRLEETYKKHLIDADVSGPFISGDK
jgi:hypothetical protein